MPRKRPTQQQVRKYLDYNPATGNFIWIRKTGYKTVVGNPAGSQKKHGYIAIQILGMRAYAHQLAWLWMMGEWPKEIDHADGNRANNKWKNLRLATRLQNNGNRGPTIGRLLPKGVVRKVNRGGSISYYGRLGVNGTKQICGPFRKTSNEAHNDYLALAKIYFGDFVRLP